MNTRVTVKFLYNLTREKKNQGFTLIELLVVIILLGVLSTVALPALLGQIAKGRHAEARATLGAINRAQQAYRYEKSIFGTIGNLPIQVGATGTYYTFSDDGTPDALHGAMKADAIATYQNDIKNYASASGQTASGAYNAVLCEDETPNEDDVSTTHAAGVVSCVDGIDLK
jgi:type IV pilus assembly protein PilA